MMNVNTIFADQYIGRINLPAIFNILKFYLLDIILHTTLKKNEDYKL